MSIIDRFKTLEQEFRVDGVNQMKWVNTNDWSEEHIQWAYAYKHCADRLRKILDDRS